MKEARVWKQFVAVSLVILVAIIIISVLVVTAGTAGPVIVAALGGPRLAWNNHWCGCWRSDLRFAGNGRIVE